MEAATVTKRISILVAFQQINFSLELAPKVFTCSPCNYLVSPSIIHSSCCRPISRGPLHPASRGQVAGAARITLGTGLLPIRGERGSSSVLHGRKLNYVDWPVPLVCRLMSRSLNSVTTSKEETRRRQGPPISCRCPNMTIEMF